MGLSKPLDIKTYKQTQLRMSSKKHSILAFVQPGMYGKQVLREALLLQQAFGFRLVVLNVLKPFSFFEKTLGNKSEANLLYEAKDELADFVTYTTNIEQSNDIRISVQIGDMESVLIEKANTGDFEFIILDKSRCDIEGPDCKNRIDKIISESNCPILTVHKDVGVPEIKNIVIPIDITQSTKKRLLWAIFFAKKFNAKVTILSMLNVKVSVKTSLAYKNANKIRKMLSDQDINCEIKVLNAHEKEKQEVILDYIEQEQPQLVIIRTHQQSILESKNIGAFVSRIVHGCKVPVFSVNYTPDPLKSFFL